MNMESHFRLFQQIFNSVILLHSKLNIVLDKFDKSTFQCIDANAIFLGTIDHFYSI